MFDIVNRCIRINAKRYLQSQSLTKYNLSAITQILCNCQQKA